MKHRTIEIHIESLVLHGFAEANRYQIAEAIRVELGRLFEVGGLPSAVTAGMEVDRLDAGSFRASSSARPQKIGTDAARKIYSGFEQ